MSNKFINFDNYITQNKKIFIYQLNSNPYSKHKPNNNIINYDVDNDNDDNIDLDEKKELYHLNISNLDLNNDWIITNNYLNYDYEQNNFISNLKNKYLDQSNGLKKIEDIEQYKIISETCKIILDKGDINIESSIYISTTVLNQSKLYDGMTNITVLTNSKTHLIKKVGIRTRAKNNKENNLKENEQNNVKENEQNNATYRNILWDLEFEECDEGYRILGLDNFIHISFVGLEEIFLDIEYIVEGSQDLSIGFLKFDRCFYNNIIKTNLANHLYENEETYSVDIIDWIVREAIDLDQQEKMYGNIYGINYEVLRIMSGMGGIGFTN